MLNKKVLAAAVIGALFAGNAAAVNLVSQNASLTALTNTPAYFAKEIVVPAAGKQLTTNGVAPISWQLGYSFSPGEVRYVRLEGPTGFKFGAGTPVVSGGTGSATVGSVNGVGTNVLYFSVTADDPADGITADAVITFAGDHTVPNTNNVTLTASLYDQPSQAQNGGDTGKIVNATATGNYLAFAQSYTLTSDNVAQAVADVEADPVFTLFEGGSDEEVLAELSYGLLDPAGPQTATYEADGTVITLADLFASAKVIIEGDFTAAANTTGTAYTGAALARVQFVDGANNADALSATAAEFNVNTTARTGDFALEVNGATAIPAGSYTARLVPVANASGNYSVSPITGVAAGSIVRNGTELQAPLAQVPVGWVTRIVLTNTSSVERPYTLSVLTEDGRTFDFSSSLQSGSVPANGTKVIELNDAAFTSQDNSGRRGTIIANVAGPNNSIQGLYQIVNPSNGLVNNHVLVRPGTN